MNETTLPGNFYELIEHQAQMLGDKPYILHEDQRVSFKGFDRLTCQAANGFLALGAEPGDGVALFMENCPEYLYVAYGLPRIGAYIVPVNTALKGDGLRYILSHSDVRYLVVDQTLCSRIEELGAPLGKIEKIIVRRNLDQPVPDSTIDLEALLDAPSDKPVHVISPDRMTIIMYTSGTTGFPKGVVNRNRNINLQGLMGLAAMMIKPDDVLFTALPLFHANALQITASLALAGGIPFGLEKRFSASSFWDAIRHYGATQFNGIGAMIPILMKQPEKPEDADNPVRLVVSSACPANLWEAFEKRFNVKIWEAYGAVDGGGALTFNFGDAPVGSVGKVLNAEWKLLGADGDTVQPGEIGELVTHNPDAGSGKVEYYKNPEASQKKYKDGWVYSGDLFYADKDGNLYFVDRQTDSMRRRGENISSFEVENIVEKHPDVETCAAFGVPSDLGEDDVMIWVKPKAERNLDLCDLVRHCNENMAYFMVPRYIDVVDDIPRTGTLRVQKTAMKKQGVTARTWDREAEMPEMKLAK